MSCAFQKYLKILHTPQRPPDLAYLKELVRTQQLYLPYENISKLVRLDQNEKNIPDIEEYIALNEEFGFGGTCFAQNGYFVQLLKNLGFKTDLIAGVRAPKSSSHVATRIHFEKENFIVDLGLFSTFCGPFSLRKDNRVQLDTGNMRYHFLARGDDLTYEMQIFRNGEISRTYEGQAKAQELSFFSDAITKSYEPNAVFMQTIATQRILNDQVMALWGKVLYISNEAGSVERYEFKNEDELAEAYAKQLHLPKYPIQRVLQILQEKNNVRIF